MSENNQTQQTPKKPCRLLKASNIRYLLIIFLFIFIISLTYKFTCIYLCPSNKNTSSKYSSIFSNFLNNNEFKIKQFSSEEEFKSYLKSISSYGNSYVGRGVGVLEFGGAPETDLAMPSFSLAKEQSYRTSTTNVQVAGIDEPDIVKVDDKNIFTSIAKNIRYVIENPVEPMPIGIESISRSDSDQIYPPIKQQIQHTEIFNAFPPKQLEKIGSIDKIGNLLLTNNILVIFTDKIIYGYNVSDTKNPREIWQIEYDENSTYKDARLYNNQVYLVTATRINQSKPCPYYPVKIDNQQFSIKCTSIYHPITPIPADLTYTILKIDPKSGIIEDTVSFLAGYQNSTLYMSENNIYLAHSYENDPVRIIADIFINAGKDLLPQDIIGKINKLASYDLSNEAKIMEFQFILNNYMSGLDNDERLKIENNFQNAVESYISKHIREFQSTGIIKIAVNNLAITATGNVPGHPLNQFSIDEYNNNLRIATNSGSSSASMLGSQKSVNDVYILNNNLKILGSVNDLGENERIYATRFINDKGYVVTFRETDPFYILDLSNPKNPQKKGELKIPGYSSYLHPINKNIILGIGKEGSNVKLSLFDVSDMSNPSELDKYSLNEYWSEAVNNHHAFLMDDKHKVFFLPGSMGGYIFSYDNNKLSLQKAVSASSVKRAVYINDYMYIIGEEGIVVLDEKNWSEVNNFLYNE